MRKFPVSHIHYPGSWSDAPHHTFADGDGVLLNSKIGHEDDRWRPCYALRSRLILHSPSGLEAIQSCQGENSGAADQLSHDVPPTLRADCLTRISFLTSKTLSIVHPFCLLRVA